MIATMIMAEYITLLPDDEENTEGISKATILMVELIYESLKVAREYIKSKLKIKD
jgi:hypothetical protein